MSAASVKSPDTRLPDEMEGVVGEPHVLSAARHGVGAGRGLVDEGTGLTAGPDVLMARKKSDGAGFCWCLSASGCDELAAEQHGQDGGRAGGWFHMGSVNSLSFQDLGHLLLEVG